MWIVTNGDIVFALTQTRREATQISKMTDGKTRVEKWQ